MRPSHGGTGPMRARRSENKHGRVDRREPACQKDGPLGCQRRFRQGEGKPPNCPIPAVRGRAWRLRHLNGVSLGETPVAHPRADTMAPSDDIRSLGVGAGHGTGMTARCRPTRRRPSESRGHGPGRQGQTPCSRPRRSGHGQRAPQAAHKRPVIPASSPDLPPNMQR